MHVLVTGGAGFIGSSLVAYHLSLGDVVHVIDDLSTGNGNNLIPFKANPNFVFTKADLLIFPGFEAMVCWADCIYHLAAVVGVFRVIRQPVRVLDVNMNGAARLLKAARVSTRNPHMFLASSAEVYGDCHLEGANESSDLTLGLGKRTCAAYIVSKMAAESLALSYYQQFGARITNLRIFNTIGPGQTGHYGMVVPRFISSVMQHKPIVVYGTGEQRRSFCDVRDVIRMIHDLVDNPKAIGQAINVGGDEDISINELAYLVKALAQKDVEIQHVTYREAYGEAFDDIMFRKPDLSLLHSLSPYRQQWRLKHTLMDLMR